MTSTAYQHLLIYNRSTLAYLLNTPLQVGAWMLRMFNLLVNFLKLSLSKALMNISTSWRCEGTNCVTIWLAWIFYLTTCQSISICFVRSWYTGFAAIWSAAWLSRNKVIGFKHTCRSLNKHWSYVSSHVAVTMDLYSASADDLETVLCFPVFHEMRESPRNTQ